MKLEDIEYRVHVQNGGVLFTCCLDAAVGRYYGEPERYTGFRLKSRKIFENDVLIDQIEEDEGDRYLVCIVTWIAEWGMWTILTHRERRAYEMGGAEALDDNSMYVFSQNDLDKYIYKGCQYGTDWDRYLKDLPAYEGE